MNRLDSLAAIPGIMLCKQLLLEEIHQKIVKAVMIILSIKT